MQELSASFILFSQIWLAAYLVLAGIYLILGWAVSYFNKAHMQSLKIQTVDCPEELVQRDFKQSLKSLINISGMLAAGLTLRHLGFGFEASETNWMTFIIWTAVSLILFDTWFYWFHRLIHHRRLYAKIHRWHHRSSTPTVWANNSDTFLDNLFCQSYWFFAPLLLPAPTAVLVAHKIYDQITGMLGHAGYEYAPGKFSAKPSPMIGTTFHDMHHSEFHYNFATHFSAWDRLMGTIHPDYDVRITRFSNTPMSTE